MARVATEAQSRSVTQWIGDHVGPKRRYKPPRREGLSRKPLRRAPKSVASRCYQLLSGHAAVGPYLKDKIQKAVDDKCWWCGGGKQQTCHHLFTECRAWCPQITRLWKDIGKAHRWKYPRGPSVKWLWRKSLRRPFWCS